METATTPQQSLRSRYIIVSATISLILIAGTLITSFYVGKVTSSQAEAIQLRSNMTQIIGHIRKSLWDVNAALNTLLVSPHYKDQHVLKKHMNEASQQMDRLWDIAATNEADLKQPVTTLRRDLNTLQRKLHKLLKLSQDTDWIYPMQPFLNEVLLESNNEFMTAATLALQEIARDDDVPYASELYRRVAQLRDIWRQQILDFRAVIIRFVTLSRVERIAQEQNIDMQHERLLHGIAELEKLKEAGQLGLETEEALPVMRYRAEKWYRDFLKLKKLREANVWRADVDFITRFIHPIQLTLEGDLAALEQALLVRSARNAERMKQTANQINLELWGFTVLALGFVALVYVMLSRSVLGPIARIAEAISDDDGHTEPLPLPTRSSYEIHGLVNAFNAMRHQIQHRQSALEYQALHDALTGLPNRALLHDRLEQVIPSSLRSGKQAALFLLDLNRFKEINDTLGHSAGDQVLQVIAMRLQSSLRKVDTVARLGGDEFAIVCPNISNEGIHLLMDKIVGRINQAISVDTQNLYVGASIGIALCPDDGTDAHLLIQHADIAMYSAKRGRRNYAFFDPSMSQMDVDNLALLGDLRQELQQPTGQFQMHYQPQIHLPDQRVLGAEALLRWQHPRQGAIPPEQVIHMAEHSGLIGELTHWVLAQAISDAAGWQRANMDVQISINLSAWNLQDPSLPKQVRQLLNDNALTENRLTLEITENAVMQDPVRAGQILDELSIMGISLAIDDYGTGLSSLAYLKKLPVGELKIDKSFVIDMLDNENDAIIVQSTIDLAHNLNLRVVAEGVENAETLERLQHAGCDSIQGFFIAHPMAEDKFRRWYNEEQTDV